MESCAPRTSQQLCLEECSNGAKRFWSSFVCWSANVFNCISSTSERCDRRLVLCYSCFLMCPSVLVQSLGGGCASEQRPVRGTLTSADRYVSSCQLQGVWSKRGREHNMAILDETCSVEENHLCLLLFVAHICFQLHVGSSLNCAGRLRF